MERFIGCVVNDEVHIGGGARNGAQSRRSTTRGSMREARHAGTRVATEATARSRRQAEANAIESVALTPYNSPDRIRAAAEASRMPATSPIAARPTPCTRTIRITASCEFSGLTGSLLGALARQSLARRDLKVVRRPRVGPTTAQWIAIAMGMTMRSLCTATLKPIQSVTLRAAHRTLLLKFSLA